jgi:hypothetical protein
MSDKTNVSSPPDPIPLSDSASASAQLIYFDGAPSFGFNVGVANITLEALVYVADGNKILTQRKIVAHLRMSAQGLFNLKRAIEGIELLTQPAPPGQAN